MDNVDPSVREHLLFQLRGGHAHMSFAEAVADFPMDRINETFPNCTYSAWGLVEHIRLSQTDILDFIRNPDYKYVTWPDDYWPPPDHLATATEWQQSLASFEQDTKELAAIVEDPATDLYAPIPHGTGQTIFREILVVTDHNAYHIGELAILRQVAGTWPPDHV